MLPCSNPFPHRDLVRIVVVYNNTQLHDAAGGGSRFSRISDPPKFRDPLLARLVTHAEGLGLSDAAC